METPKRLHRGRWSGTAEPEVGATPAAVGASPARAVVPTWRQRPGAFLVEPSEKMMPRGSLRQWVFGQDRLHACNSSGVTSTVEG